MGEYRLYCAVTRPRRKHMGGDKHGGVNCDRVVFGSRLRGSNAKLVIWRFFNVYSEYVGGALLQAKA